MVPFWVLQDGHMFTRYRSYEDIPVFTVAAYVCVSISTQNGGPFWGLQMTVDPSDPRGEMSGFVISRGEMCWFRDGTGYR